MGNRNNLLLVPSKAVSNGSPDLHSAGNASHSPQSRLSETTHDANARRQRNQIPELSTSTEAPRLVTPAEEDEIPSTPLFAHESLGAYDFDVVDDGFDHSLSPTVSRGMSVSSFAALSPDTLDPDTDDPTLEKFPCDKSAVMDTIRRISTSTGDVPLSLEDHPSPPRLTSRRDSVDSATDSLPSPGSLSPTSSRKRDGRLSHSSVGRTKSAVSLGSIVEEPQREAGKTPSRSKRDDYDSVGVTSDEDGPQIKGSKVSSAGHDNDSCDSQASSVALSPKTPEKGLSESRSSKKHVGWEQDDLDGPIEGRWYERVKYTSAGRWTDLARFITGGVVLLAIGLTWWKSCRD